MSPAPRQTTRSPSLASSRTTRARSPGPSSAITRRSVKHSPLSAVVVHCETEFLKMYADQPLFSEIELFLRGRGFAFHRFFPIVSRMVQPLSIGDDIYAGMSQQFWADSVFIRDLTRLDALSDKQILAMAAILHDCYQSLDVVVHLLIAYGRRTGRELAGVYLGNLRASAAPQAA